MHNKLWGSSLQNNIRYANNHFLETYLIACILQYTGDFDGISRSLLMNHFLFWDDNKFDGTLPSDFGSKMPNLLDCYIGSNKFSGNLPTSIRSFTKLHTFYAYSNQLSGSIPDAFNSMKNLLHLNISGNHFEGPLPTGMGLFSNLREIDVSSNKMSGTLPNSYAPLSKLRTFAISNNVNVSLFYYNWNAIWEIYWNYTSSLECVGWYWILSSLI